MYLTQSITINLVDENETKLKQPSKFLNKLGSTLMGGMTPAEQGSAAVMVSVLDRICESLKMAGVQDLHRLRVNETIVYDDSHGSSQNDLDEAIVISESISRGEFKSIDSLRMVLGWSNESSSLTYLIHVELYRFPPAGKQPVAVHVVGLLKEFEAREGETNDALLTRMRDYANTNITQDQDKLKQFDQLIQNTFCEFVIELQTQLNYVFPAGASLSDITKQVKPKNAPSKPRESISIIDDFGDDDDLFSSLMYLWLWDNIFYDEGFSGVDLDEELGWEHEALANCEELASGALEDSDACTDNTDDDNRSWTNDYSVESSPEPVASSTDDYSGSSDSSSDYSDD